MQTWVDELSQGGGGSRRPQGGVRRRGGNADGGGALAAVQSLLSRAVQHIPAASLGLLLGFWWGRWQQQQQGGAGGPRVSGGVPKKGGKGGGVGRGTLSFQGSSHANVPSGPAHSAYSDLKMVLVVRQDLKMSSGKIAAQCAHAAVGVCQEVAFRNRALFDAYERCGQPKIVVVCKNLKEMQELEGKAKQMKLPSYVISDAGRTQVAAGSKTVLAVGPGNRTAVDSVTGNLRLL